MPVSFSMLLVGIAGFMYLVTPQAGLSLLGSDLFAQFSNYNFTVFPTFLLAGSFAYVTGMGNRLFDACYVALRRLPGNLVLGTTAACAGFAAICGSSTATAATLGKIALPVMKKYNYDEALATGAIAAGGCLGPLIPPSTVFIIYAILTEQSIGQLFVAGIFPGILLTVLMVITVIILCVRKPSLAPMGPPTNHRQKLSGVAGLTEAAILFSFIMVGLSLGWFSPTQGGAALGGAILLLGLIRRKINMAGFTEAVKDSVKITCMIIVIMAGGIIFGRFMAVSHLPMMLSNWLSELTIAPIVIMIILMLIYIILGCFLDTMAVMVLTIPIVFPTVTSLGFDPIWFGVMLVIVGGMGSITPPVGINVYVVHGVAKDVPLETIFKGILPFVGSMAVCLAILMVFPQIATYLPSLIRY